MPDIQESSDNHFVSVGALFAKEAEQRVIEENGSLVTPAYTQESSNNKDEE